jgi:hypothetical protein
MYYARIVAIILLSNTFKILIQLNVLKILANKDNHGLQIKVNVFNVILLVHLAMKLLHAHHVLKNPNFQIVVAFVKIDVLLRICLKINSSNIGIVHSSLVKVSCIPHLYFIACDEGCT